ncbi:MAG TPA: hypothetical protein VNZ52_06345 [Candidatus Thermoplasmatota archaeon]|nr:hypothetical protein [Candidatus Thermoplasmatota archaeon]
MPDRRPFPLRAAAIASVGLLLFAGVLALVPKGPENAPGKGGPVGDATAEDPSYPVKDAEPTGEYAVHLLVNATEGPYGGAPIPTDKRLLGTNLWYGTGWWPKKDPDWVAMLKAMDPGVLRWPAGHPSQHYCFDPENDGTGFPGCHGPVYSGKQFEAFVNLSREVGGEPLVGVNVKEGSPEMAAAMVRYLNVEKGLKVKYWHLGNEPDLGHNPAGLGQIINAWPKFSAAMRKVDSSIYLIGPEIMTGAHVTASHGRNDWIRPFLEANPGDVEGISWHLYPLDSENRRPTSGAYPTAEHLLQWWANDWVVSGIRFVDVASEKLRKDRDELMPKAEIWVTELGPDSGDPGAPGITDAQVAAVWFADVLGRFAEGGTAAITQFAYDHWVPGKDELSLIRRGDGKILPLPPWYTYYLYAEHWGNRVVDTHSSDDAHVSVHASTRADGKLTVIVVNKKWEPVTARLTLNGINPVEAAEAYVLTAPSGSSLDASINNMTLDSKDFLAGNVKVPPAPGPESRDTLRVLPPLSVTVLVVDPK